MTTAVLVGYIDQHRQEFGVEPICTVLRQAGMPIAPSSYYAAKTRPPSARAVADEQRLAVIRTVHADNVDVVLERIGQVDDLLGGPREESGRLSSITEDAGALHHQPVPDTRTCREEAIDSAV